MTGATLEAYVGPLPWVHSFSASQVLVAEVLNSLLEKGSSRQAQQIYETLKATTAQGRGQGTSGDQIPLGWGFLMFSEQLAAVQCRRNRSTLPPAKSECLRGALLVFYFPYSHQPPNHHKRIYDVNGTHVEVGRWDSLGDLV